MEAPSGSSSKKRTLLEAIADDEPTLHIKLPDGQRSIPAHRELMRFDVSCVRELPPTDTWDLGSLLIEGKPVERAVVVAWLQTFYAGSMLDNGSLQPEEDQEQPDPVRLLLFADAVGSSRRIIRACYERCKEQVVLRLQLPEGDNQRELPVQLDGRWWTLDIYGTLQGVALDGSEVVHTLTLPVGEKADLLGSQIAAQLEPLLLVAYKLQLEDLQDKLHAFVRQQVDRHARDDDEFSLLPLQVLKSAVLTPRVMAAADLQQLQDAWIKSIVDKPLILNGEGAVCSRLNGGASRDNLVLKAQGLVLQQPYLGSPAGTRFDFEFDMENSVLSLQPEGGSQWLPSLPACLSVGIGPWVKAPTVG